MGPPSILARLKTRGVSRALARALAWLETGFAERTGSFLLGEGISMIRGKRKDGMRKERYVPT